MAAMVTAAQPSVFDHTSDIVLSNNGGVVLHILQTKTYHLYITVAAPSMEIMPQ